MPEITVGSCPCSAKRPHKKFLSDGEPLHSDGFFSIQVGAVILDHFIEGGDIPESERARLMTELESSGLPAEPLDQDIRKAVEAFCFLNEEKLTQKLEFGVEKGFVTAKQTVLIREQIAKLTNEEKIDLAVDTWLTLDVNDPQKLAELRESVAPELVDGLIEELEQARAVLSELDEFIEVLVLGSMLS